MGEGHKPGSGAFGWMGGGQSRGEQERQASLPESFIPSPTHSSLICSVHKYLVSTNCALSTVISSGDTVRTRHCGANVEPMFSWGRDNSQMNKEKSEVVSKSDKNKIGESDRNWSNITHGGQGKDAPMLAQIRLLRQTRKWRFARRKLVGAHSWAPYLWRVSRQGRVRGEVRLCCNNKGLS